MKVAYYSPLPPDRSGIADYSALLLPALQRRLGVVPMRRGRRRPPRDADIALYHIGNDPDVHAAAVEALRAWPGVVVLHELVLHHLVAGLTLGRKDVATYLSAMEREAGLVGRLLALGVVDGCIPPLWESRPDDFPLTDLILEATQERGVIAHSRYVAERIRARGYAGPVWTIPHPAWPVPDVEPARVAAGPVIGCFGHINASKRIPQLLDAFRGVHARHAEVRLLLVGPVSSRFDLHDAIARADLPSDAVLVESYVEEERLWALMAGCDACVSLRAPTMGETSGSAIRALSLGKPLVVSDVGWFSELPDDVAFKAPVDEHEVATLARALETLVTDERVRTVMSARAREHAEREHGLERVADLYAAALEQAAGGASVREAVVTDLAAAAADVGIAAGTEEAEELAVRVREARIGE